ncbi:MAG: hypothetical protein RL685_4112 [Pseudomonadota bacterium]
MRSRLTFALRQVVNPRRTTVRSFWLHPVPLLGLLACSAGETAAPPPAPLGDANEPPPQIGAVNCDSPQAGCPCVEVGARIECGSVSERRGDYVICSMGTRTCNDGTWGECTGSDEFIRNSTSNVSNLRLQALSTAENCKDLCSPDCMTVVDDPDGLIVDDDLVADPGGLTLPGGTWGGSCSDLSITPLTSTVTITQIAASGAVTSSPSPLNLAGACTGGAVVQPSWSIDSYDRAVIDGQGALSVFSGIASPILVTAASSADSSTALVNVRVNIEDRGSNVAAATALDGAGSADTGTASKTLYPYKNTVFPLDLKAPLVQWDPGSNTATAVQVALRYQVSGESTPRFWWSRIYNAEPKQGTLASTSPAWQIPQEIWSAFDRSAAGASTGAEIIIQRYYSGAARTAMTIPVRFATAALSGTVYYTQYLRTLTTCNTNGQTPINAATYAPGNICPVGLCTISSSAGAATTRAIDLSTPSAPNKDPFNGTAGCPVCHSVSVNGTRYTSVNQASQVYGGGTSSGVDSIGLDASGNPVFTAVGTAPNYTGPSANNDVNGEASYGFSFGALLPDGSQLLQGSAYWGNTLDTPAANNTQDGVMRGIANNAKPYFFVPTVKSGAGVQFATTGPLPANTRATHVLTASGNGTLTVDNVVLASGNSVLVKHEATSTNNGVYTLTQVGSGSTPWKLTRRSDFDSSTEVSGGLDVRVSDGNASRGKAFYISTPASGGVNVNSVAMTFSERVRPAISYTTPLVAKFATAGILGPGTVVHSGNTLTAGTAGVLTVDGVAVASGEAVLVKDQAAPAQNGLYTLTTVGVVVLTKWVLTRHPSFDTAPSTTNDARPGMEVRVTNGSTNAGKVFAISSPVTGAITVNATAISFKQTELPSMMVPAFSPDGSKVVYVNGDADPHPSALTGTQYDTGWRRGLSMFSYNTSTLTVSNKKRLVNNYSSGSPGTPIKWPFFEPDNRSLLYVQTHANEYCPSNSNLGRCAAVASETFANTTCTADASVNVNTNIERACFEGSRGSMAPTTRGFWPGRLYSLDSSATTVSGTIAELAKLNNGDDDGGADDATDAGKSYQPTVLPFSVGGYRWVIFTSPRPYGNQFNMKGTHFSCGASMLWVAAIDDLPSSGSDRSHPAFFLPGQKAGRVIDTNHFVNERGYLVPSLCKAAGTSCTTNDNCCGGSGASPTAACRAPAGWTPASGPPAKTCATLSGTCSNAGGSCNSPADCCNSAACVDFRCEAPPTFEPAEFTRDYEADCPDSYQPEWGLLSFYLTTEGDSSLDFNIQAANTAAGLSSATVRHLGESSNDIVSPAQPDFLDVKDVLDQAKQNGLNHLRMTITFNPSTNALYAPVLHDWEMRYTCVAAQ